MDSSSENLIIDKDKNKYLRIFQGVQLPMILLDDENQIEDINQSAIELLRKINTQVNFENSNQYLECLISDLEAFISSNKLEFLIRKVIETGGDTYYLLVKMNKIFDSNNKYQGTIISVKDYSNYKRIEKQAKNQYEFEKAVSEISSRFIGLSNINDSINYALCKIGKISGASRAYVFLINNNQATMSNTHEWCSEGVTPQIDNLKNLPLEIFPWWMDKIFKNEIINIEDILMLPKEAATEKEILKSQDIKSLLVLPLNNSGKSIGYIGFDNVENASICSEENLLLLKIVSGIFVRALEKKAIEDELRKSEERFKFAINFNDGGIWDWNLESNNLYVSKRWKEILGYDDAEIPDRIKEWQKLLHPDDYERYTKELKKYIRDKKTSKFEIECRIKIKNDEYKWILSRGKAIRDENGQAIRMLGIDIDITEIKKKEEMIKHRLKFEKNISMISSHFLGDIDVDIAIKNAITDIGRFINASHVELCIFNEERTIIENVYEWCNKDVNTQLKYLKDTPMILCPWFMKQLYEGKVINVENVSKMPREARSLQSELLRQDIKAILVLPLLIGRKLNGYLYINNILQTTNWREEDILLLKLTADILVKAIEKDIIDKKLKENEIKYRSLVEFLPDAFIVHRENKIILANSESVKLLGFKKKEEFIGRSIFSIIHPDYHKAIKERIDFLKENLNEIAPMIEEKLIAVDGNIIDAEVTSTSFTTDGERVIISVFRDITNRKKRENDIITLSRAVEQSPSSIVITDIKGNIEYVNPKFLEITGYTFSEVIEENTRILKSGEQSTEFYEELWNTIASGNEWRGEFHNKRKNGELFWEFASISPIKDLRDNVIGYIAVKEDITDRKIMEKKFIQSNKYLKETVKKLKETQIQLIQQEQLAGIGQLAAGVAHEINNPLGFINSNFKVLTEYIEDYNTLLELYGDLKNEILSNNYDKYKELLEKVIKLEKEKDIEFIYEDIDALLSDSNEGIERIQEIVKGLRMFSRVDQLNEFEGYDLNEGIKTTLIVARNEIKYDAEVEVSFEDIPTIKAIGGQVNQVLLNIIVNAAYAIKEKDSEEFGLIKISTYSDSEFIYAKIEDNGIGISKGNLNKIFNPFFTTKSIGDGTGLGLGIAYEIIVNKHKGDIWVESELNKGSCFYIKLPIEQDKNFQD